METFQQTAEAEMLTYINKQPILLEMLYDLNLLPEQTISKPDGRKLMFTVACAYKLGMEAH